MVSAGTRVQSLYGAHTPPSSGITRLRPTTIIISRGAYSFTTKPYMHRLVLLTFIHYYIL